MTERCMACEKEVDLDAPIEELLPVGTPLGVLCRRCFELLQAYQRRN